MAETAAVTTPSRVPTPTFLTFVLIKLLYSFRLLPLPIKNWLIGSSNSYTAFIVDFISNPATDESNPSELMDISLPK